MDSGKFAVADTSGNTTVGGTLNVAGASILGSTLVVSGAVTQVSTPVFAQAAAAAPTNTASAGFTVTVNGTNYVLGLYPN
jgi:hypothetical protein